VVFEFHKENIDIATKLKEEDGDCRIKGAVGCSSIMIGLNHNANVKIATLQQTLRHTTHITSKPDRGNNPEWDERRSRRE